MIFIDRAPPPPLDRYIRTVWYCENGPRPFALERVLPNGSPQLTINLKEDQSREYRLEDGQVRMFKGSGTVLSGISSQYVVIDTAEQECVAGVSFRPGGTVPFFRTPPEETCDSGVPLELEWGRARTEQLRDELLCAGTPADKLTVLERALADAWIARDFDRAVAFALDTFTRRPEASTIAAITEAAGLSRKRFIERFRRSVGMAPKRYCRILRFQRAVAGAERGRGVDWTRIALDCGYFDQAHFIHDFRAFAGITPTGYEAGRTQFRNHVHFLQSEAAPLVR